TPRGLAAQLSLPMPNGPEDMAALLPRAAFALLDELAASAERPRREAGAIATMMTASGWPWGPVVLAHLGLPLPPDAPPDGRLASIFGRLPEYTEFSATPPPGSAPGSVASEMDSLLASPGGDAGAAASSSAVSSS
ncbi:MAG: ATP-dependent DNA helicase, partial [Pseudomonadota bacterium]|nr:ATP-dependent DNA helicase [Pseudomonadota bacterium]